MCCVCDPSVCLGFLYICQICVFNSEIEGSLMFCALVLILCSILCSGSSLHVKMAFPVCMSGGG